MCTDVMFCCEYADHWHNKSRGRLSICSYWRIRQCSQCSVHRFAKQCGGYFLISTHRTVFTPRFLRQILFFKNVMWCWCGGMSCHRVITSQSRSNRTRCRYNAMVGQRYFDDTWCAPSTTITVTLKRIPPLLAHWSFNPAETFGAVVAGNQNCGWEVWSRSVGKWRFDKRFKIVR